MSGKKEQFSAVIKLAAEMGGSVKSVFDGAKKETDKLGTALTKLYDKQKKAGAGMDRERSFKDAEANLRHAQKRQAQADKIAAAEPWNKGAQKAAAIRAKETTKAIALMDKEAKALHKVDAAMKAAGLDSNKLAHETAKLGTEIERMEKKMQARERWGKVGSTAWKIGAIGAGAVAGVVGTAFAMARHEATAAREMMALSRGLGITPEYLQTYRRLGKGVAVESGVVDSILLKTTRSIEKAQSGKGKEFAALRSLKLNVAALRKMKPEQAIIGIANALNKYDGKANKSVLFSALTGRAGPDVARFVSALSKGGLEIEKTKNEGVADGSIIKKKDLENSEKLDSALRDLTKQSTILKNAISEAVTPSFTAFFETVSKTVKENMPEIREWAEKTGESLNHWVESGEAKKAIKDIGGLIEGATKLVGKLVDNFGAATTAATALGAVTIAPFATGLARAAASSAKLLWNLGKIALKLGGGTAAGGAAAEGAGGAAAAWAGTFAMATAGAVAADVAIPLIISGDTHRQTPGDIRADKGRFQTRKRIKQLEEQINFLKSQMDMSREDLKSPESFSARWHRMLYGPTGDPIDLREKLEQAKKALELTKHPVENSPLKAREQTIYNSPTFTFNITAAPGQTIEQFYGDVYSKIKQSYPALSTGVLHD